MRFFVKNRFDVHNSGMATDRHQAPSYPLRMPEELKARVQAAADVSGRSLHAELLQRLLNSFEAMPWLQQMGLLEMAEEAAKETGRTVEGEVYARLLDSLNNWNDVNRLRDALEREREENHRLRTQLEDRAGVLGTVYLLLDASGYPISWDEIGTLWKAVTKAVGVNAVNLEAAIITPEMVSSSERRRESAQLAKKLRAGGKSTVLPPPPKDPVLDAITKACAEEDPTKPAKRPRKPKA